MLEGFSYYVENKNTHEIYEFLPRYVQKLYPDSVVTERLCKNAGMEFLDYIEEFKTHMGPRDDKVR